MRYLTKGELFCQVDWTRKKYCLGNYPISSYTFAERCCINPVIEPIAFESSKIGGMLHRGSKTTTIAVNAFHSTEQQNFYCSHEVFHYLLHDEHECSPICAESPGKQNSAIEWQANEAAAELLVPHKLFIPLLVEMSKNYEQEGAKAITDTKISLARYFGVTQQIITHRIDDLKFEICQYIEGVPISDLKILSYKEQVRQNIEVESLNNVEARLQLLEDFGDMYTACVICGKEGIDADKGICDSCRVSVG